MSKNVSFVFVIKTHFILMPEFHLIADICGSFYYGPSWLNSLSLTIHFMLQQGNVNLI